MLTEDEIEQCKEAFNKFDRDKSGKIDVWELKAILQSMGQNPSEEELFQMIAQVDDDGSGSIDFGEFLRAIMLQKKNMQRFDDETDTVDAFVAMGGNPDKSGEVSVDKIRKVCVDFGLTLDIDQLIAEADTDGSGFVDYEEFKEMLAAKY